MKITFVLPTPNRTGGMRVLSIYAQSLQQRGHKVLVVCTPEEVPSFMQRLQSLVRGRGWESTPKKEASHFDNLDVELRFTDKYRPITDRDVPDADVIVATWWETANWVAKLSPSKGAKAYFLQHYEVFDYLPKDKVKATWSLSMHKIPVSQWLVDIARDKYKDHDVSLVPPSVDTKKFSAPPRGKQSVPTIGMYYITTAWKGCDIAMKAFSLAAAKIPNLRLVVFGAGESFPVDFPLPNVSEYIRQPTEEQIKECYSKCDAWLFSSRSEGFGLPILEAMACRTPVIGTPAGAAPELLASGGGILVKPEDPEDMAKAIERICQLSDAEWRAMSDAALAEVTNYTWEDATDLFEAALYTAIERQSELKDRVSN
jgi:glycosyltransferase involved in cell wall biosynthesis